MKTDRRASYAEVNRKTPVVPFRVSSREYYDEIRQAAAAKGLSLSEWIRQAVAKALEEEK